MHVSVARCPVLQCAGRCLEHFLSRGSEDAQRPQAITRARTARTPHRGCPRRDADECTHHRPGRYRSTDGTQHLRRRRSVVDLTALSTTAAAGWTPSAHTVARVCTSDALHTTTSDATEQDRVGRSGSGAPAPRSSRNATLIVRSGAATRQRPSRPTSGRFSTDETVTLRSVATS